MRNLEINLAKYAQVAYYENLNIYIYKYIIHYIYIFIFIYNWWTIEACYKLQVPYNSVIILLGIYPNQLKICVCTNIYNNFIHNCHRFEATKMSFNSWIDKQTIGHPYNEILFSKKNKWAIYQATKKYEGNVNKYYLVQKASLKSLCDVCFQLYDILEKLRRQDYCLPGVRREGEINWHSTEDFCILS